MTRIKLVDGPLCPGAYSPVTIPEPRAVELWEKWKGKTVTLSNVEANLPNSPNYWNCGTDVLWDVVEISQEAGKTLAVCRHMIEAGD